MASHDLDFKVLLLGVPSTGKEEFVNRYISKFFIEDISSTVGVDFYTRIQEFRNKKIQLQIWNFGGQERFKFLLEKYCRGADGAIIMYDITNLESLDQLPDWTQIIREHAGTIPILLVGNKFETGNPRTISKEEAILTAKRYNLSGCVEISSRTGQNVEKTFEILTKILVESYESKI